MIVREMQRKLISQPRAKERISQVTEPQYLLLKTRTMTNSFKAFVESIKSSMTDPEIPQLVDGAFQCPPGSLR